jgi:hypothetical protein
MDNELREVRMLLAPLGSLRLLLGLVAAIAAVAVAGAPTTAYAGTAALSAVYWYDAHQRWRDVSTTPYDAGKIASYDYASAEVVFAYQDDGTTIGGEITGSNLKPNFAYQLKLNGKPSYFWGLDGNDIANERIGFAGRWWLNKVEKATGTVVGGWNSNDAEYVAWKDQDFTDGVYDYVYEGYLLFAYLVTDEGGHVAQGLAIDSSHHVLWKTAQRARGTNDSSPTMHTFVVNEASGWYANSQPDVMRSIYAEWEPTRALPGQLALPAGAYAARLFLTEESFHESTGSPASGSWATVMTHDEVEFVITTPVPALSPSGLALLLLALVCLATSRFPGPGSPFESGVFPVSGSWTLGWSNLRDTLRGLRPRGASRHDEQEEAIH